MTASGLGDERDGRAPAEAEPTPPDGTTPRPIDPAAAAGVAKVLAVIRRLPFRVVWVDQALWMQPVHVPHEAGLSDAVAE